MAEAATESEFEAGGVHDLRSAPPWMRGLGHALDAMAAFGTASILVIMALIVADISGRNLLGRPVVGVAEIASRGVVAMVFLMLPSAALRGTLIRADFLTRMIRARSPRLLRGIEFAFALLSALLFAVLALAVWPDTAAAWRSGEFFGVRGVWTLPAFPFRLVNLVGAVATAVSFAAVAVRLMRLPVEGR